ncbi:hypothetical protein [Nonomuraea sp. NPDC050643]|uniref:hypothetical protein n=1 Tax=Nonomuraea sp. NPDC050643 TaxID=3155660 RepID=UPI0033D24285
MSDTTQVLPTTRAIDVDSQEFSAWAGRVGPPGDAAGQAAVAGMQLTVLHAYRNNRPQDWNTCGQAAIATVLDFHGRDPFGLPRPRLGVDGKQHWDDGEIIDALQNAGYRPDVVFGLGSTGGLIRDALLANGLSAGVGWSGAFSGGWQDQWRTLQAYVALGRPVPVCVDLGVFGGSYFTAHWAVAYRIENDTVHLANCPWAPQVPVARFLQAWHCWFLPIGFNHCGVYAQP